MIYDDRIADMIHHNVLKRHVGRRSSPGRIFPRLYPNATVSPGDGAILDGEASDVALVLVSP